MKTLTKFHPLAQRVEELESHMQRLQLEIHHHPYNGMQIIDVSNSTSVEYNVVDISSGNRYCGKLPRFLEEEKLTEAE